MGRMIILSVRNWEMRDEKTGEFRSGVKVEGCEEFVNEERDYRGSGFLPFEARPEVWETLKGSQLPAICEFSTYTKRGKNKSGATVGITAIASVKYIAPIDFTNAPPAKLAA